MKYNPGVDFSNSDSVKEWLENTHEKFFFEMKKSSGALPNDFWPSYSSFANTSGGWIILGVIEKQPQNEIFGVSNPDSIIMNLWNLLSNPQKVSYRCVENTDVQRPLGAFFH